MNQGGTTMKKAAIRLFAVMLAVTIVLGTACAFADGGWDCTACGQSGTTGNFCSNCGAKRPAPIMGWDCVCGQKGNLGNFCSNCGARKPEASTTWDCTCGKKGITGICYV